MPKYSDQRITQSTVYSAKARDRRYEIRDSGLTGFMLRVSPSGRKCYYVQIERGQKRKLGDANILTLQQARTKAIEMLNGGEIKGQAEQRGKSEITLGKFLLDEYRPHVLDSQKSGEATIARILSTFDRLLDTKLSNLNELQIERWKRSRQRRVKAITAKRDLAAFSAALNAAVRWGFIESNPAAGVTVRVDEEPRVRYLTEAERKALYSALRARDEEKASQRLNANEFRADRGYHPLPRLGKFADYLTPLVLLVLNTGLRRSEALNLKWNDVDLGESPNVKIEAKRSKNSKVRYVPLNHEAVSVMTEWKSICPSHDLVFPSPKTGLAMGDIKSSWTRLMKRAGLSDFRFHDLRHDFASQLVMRRVGLYEVQALLGHSSLDVTQKYAHLSPEKLADAVSALN